MDIPREEDLLETHTCSSVSVSENITATVGWTSAENLSGDV